MYSRHLLGNICRNIGALWLLAGERVDPQPPVEWKDPGYVAGTRCTGTTADGAKITFYRTPG